MTKTYAGIGARKTPRPILGIMQNVAEILEGMGWTLRTGGAQGADTAFYNGMINPNMLQMFIPWEGFQGFTCNDAPVYAMDRMHSEIFDAAMEIAARHHPAWDSLNNSVRLLMARNVLQVLGPELNDHSKFIVCWTPNGAVTGGTGQALRIAETYQVPVINLGCLTPEQADEKLGEYL